MRASEPALGAVRLVCVDGPAGSGKTTLADRLGRELGAQVLHVDDLLEGWDDLEGMWPWFQAGVLDPLAAGRPGRYRRYDWVAGRFAEWHDVPVADVLVLEGCGSARRAVDGVAVLRVWVEAPADLRLARGLARDGEALRPHWLAWMRLEAAHFDAQATRARADVLVDADDAGPAAGPVRREWFARDVLAVAPDLLGAYLTTVSDSGRVTLRLTEVEAYRGADDPASHAFRGRTDRNAAMFGEPGRLYVYRHLGLHTCANIVCGASGSPSAVLLRAGEVVEGADLALERRARAGVVRSDRDLARGPARLAVALGIDLTWDGTDLIGSSSVVVHLAGAGAERIGHVAGAGAERVGHPAGSRAERTVATGPRVGVGGAGGDPERYPWRYWLDDEPTVCDYRQAARRDRDSRARRAVRQTRPHAAGLPGRPHDEEDLGE